MLADFSTYRVQMFVQLLDHLILKRLMEISRPPEFGMSARPENVKKMLLRKRKRNLSHQQAQA